MLQNGGYNTARQFLQCEDYELFMRLHSRGYRGCNLILVFDAYKVPQNLGTVEKYHNIFIVYTQEAETADSYIERVTYELRGRKKVRVATSDNLEQLIILGHGAVRVSAKSFRDEVMQTQQEIERVIAQNNQKSK